MNEASFSLLSVIIPAYNEENTIQVILEKVIAVQLPAGLEKEIIVVDDHSVDSTVDLVKRKIDSHPEMRLQLVCHSKNLGKGRAIQTGIAEARGDLLIIQDADLEYEPAEYPLLLEPVLSGRADVVYGSRFIGGKPHRVLFFWHSIGNKILTFLSNAATNLNLTDMETCYKLFVTDYIKRLELEEERFGFEPEVTAKISRIPGIRIYEVGISYHGRTFSEGKKINWKDGFRAIYCIIKYGFLKM